MCECDGLVLVVYGCDGLVLMVCTECMDVMVQCWLCLLNVWM